MAFRQPHPLGRRHRMHLRSPQLSHPPQSRHCALVNADQQPMYTKSEQAPCFSTWYGGLGLKHIIGGVLSYAFQQVKRERALEGWRIMFVFWGIGRWCGCRIRRCRRSFLGEKEKVMLLRHVAVDRTGVRHRGFKARQVLEVVLDAQIWLLTLLTILVRL